MSGICRIASRPIAENHRTGCDGLGTDSLTHWKSQGCRGKHGVTTHYHSGLPQRVNVSRLQGWPEFQLLLAIRNAFVLTAETSSTLNIRSHCRKEWLPGVYTHAPHSKQVWRQNPADKRCGLLLRHRCGVLLWYCGRFRVWAREYNPPEAEKP